MIYATDHHPLPAAPTAPALPGPLPDSTSALERSFAFYWRVYAGSAPPYVHEFHFGAHYAGGMGRGLRKRLTDAGLQDWRFDFAWVAERVAVEIEGGTFQRGRHTRGKGYADDCRKYNAAAVRGWVVLRYTADMLRDDPQGVVEQVAQMVRERAGLRRAA